jgi:formylglycine-generating enzyme required for sulfatase activity
MISKWEAGGEKINPRPVNQSALDSSLAAAPPDVHGRFEEILDLTRQGDTEAGADDGYSVGSPLTLTGHQVRHPIDGKLMTLVEAGEFLYGDDDESRFIPEFYIDVFPTTNADYARFVTATGHRTPQHWSNSGEPPGHLLNHPVVFVTWHDAVAYASWAAKALPSNEQ